MIPNHYQPVAVDDKLFEIAIGWATTHIRDLVTGNTKHFKNFVISGKDAVTPSQVVEFIRAGKL